MKGDMEQERLQEENRQLRDTIRQLNQTLNRLIGEYIARPEGEKKQP